MVNVTKQFLFILTMAAISFAGIHSIKANDLDVQNKIVDVKWNDQNASLELLKRMQVENEKDNNVISPLSLDYSFYMLLLGANGSTKDEMINFLGIEDESFESYLHTARSLLTHSKAEDSPIFIKNAIFAKSDLNIQQSFIDKTNFYFDTDVIQIDIKKDDIKEIINSWVQKYTHNKIDNFLDQNMQHASSLVLINILNSNYTWEKAFNETYTYEDIFTSSTGENSVVKMMVEEGEMFYVENNTYKAIQKDMAKGSFIALLPEGDINDFMEKMTSSELASLLRDLNITSKKTKEDDSHVVLKLPRFSINKKTNYTDSFMKLGLSTMFSPLNADFSNITNKNLYVSNILQECTIQFNETGVEGTAATGIVMDIAPNPEYVKRVTFNKPFIFAIYGEHDELVFVGIKNK